MVSVKLSDDHGSPNTFKVPCDHESSVVSDNDDSSGFKSSSVLQILDTTNDDSRTSRCSIADCLVRVLNEVSIPSPVKVTNLIPDGLPEVVANSRELQFVFRNIVRHACETMCNGGELDISAEAVAPDGVVVSVRDTGERIETEHYQRITGPVFSTESRSVGLVLALSSNVLQRNQGTLEVKRSSRGNEFLVQLLTTREDC